MSPVRLTPAQAAQLQRRRAPSDGAPEAAKLGRAPRHPILADTPREPSRLLSVTVTAPRQDGGGWTVTAEYNDGRVSVSVPTKKEADELKAGVERGKP